MDVATAFDFSRLPNPRPPCTPFQAERQAEAAHGMFPGYAPHLDLPGVDEQYSTVPDGSAPYLEGEGQGGELDVEREIRDSGLHHPGERAGTGAGVVIARRTWFDKLTGPGGREWKLDPVITPGVRS